MTTRMTKEQILNVNAEQAKTIRKIMEENRHKQQIIDQMLHDKEPPAKKHPSEMNAAELREYVQSPDAQIANLQGKVNYLNKLTWGPDSHESRLQILERFKDQIDVADDIIAGRMQILEERVNDHIEGHIDWLNNRNDELKRLDDVCARMEEKLKVLSQPEVEAFIRLRAGMAQRENLTASDPPKYKKDDPFLAHEALDRTNMVMEVLYDHVEQHPFVLMHPEILEKIVQAGELLASAYQDIGNAS